MNDQKQSLRQRAATALRANATALDAVARKIHSLHASANIAIKMCDDTECEEHQEVRADSLGVLQELESPADLDQSFEPDEETIERICAWLATRARYRRGIAETCGRTGLFIQAHENRVRAETLSNALTCIKDGCPFTPRSRWE